MSRRGPRPPAVRTYRRAQVAAASTAALFALAGSCFAVGVGRSHPVQWIVAAVVVALANVVVWLQSRIRVAERTYRAAVRTAPAAERSVQPQPVTVVPEGRR